MAKGKKYGTSSVIGTYKSWSVSLVQNLLYHVFQPNMAPKNNFYGCSRRNISNATGVSEWENYFLYEDRSTWILGT